MKTPSLPARRPCAGAVPGRWGACLAVRAPPAAFVCAPILSRPRRRRCAGGSRQRDYFAAGARAQRLKRGQVGLVTQEAHGAVGEGEVGTARMAAAEGAGPILQRGSTSPGQHPVVDRYGGAERDLGIGPHVRDVTPPPDAAEESYSGPKFGLLAVEFRVTMVALAEEERVAGAVGDVPNTNVAANVEDAVPGHAGRMDRPFAGVAAITAYPMETPGPRGRRGWVGERFREFHHGFRQRVRRAEQDLDDLGLCGIPTARDVVAVILVVPQFVQVVLSEVGEQLGPHVGAPGRTITHVDGKQCPGREPLPGVVVVVRRES